MVDLIQIMDLILNPPLVNDLMGKVFLFSPMLTQLRLVHAQ